LAATGRVATVVETGTARIGCPSAGAAIATHVLAEIFATADRLIGADHSRLALRRSVDAALGACSCFAASVRSGTRNRAIALLNAKGILGEALELARGAMGMVRSGL